MDGWEVEDVEAELLHVGEAGDDVVEGAVTLRIVGGRAREELVPGGEACLDPVDLERQPAVELREVGPREVPLDQVGDLDIGHPVEERAGRIARSDLLRQRLDPLPRVGAGSRGGLFEKDRSLLQLDRDIHPCLVLPLEIPPPGGEAVRPGDDGVLPAAVLVERAGRSAPAVVLHMVHPRLPPAPLTLAAVAKRRRQDVVAILEDVRLYAQGVTDLAFHGVPAAIELRGDVLDDDAPTVSGSS